MKKILFVFVLVMIAAASCTKDESLLGPPIGSPVNVDYKPMPKAFIPVETVELRHVR